jgi:hypothetical protein
MFLFIKKQREVSKTIGAYAREFIIGNIDVPVKNADALF